MPIIRSRKYFICIYVITIPLIDDTMNTLLRVKNFSKLDLCSGYWKVEKKKEDKEKTAFTVGDLGF